MNKLLKFLAVFLLLSVATLVVAAYATDINAYKDEIQAEFRVATGHELVIAGDLQLALFPELALELRQASVPEALDGGAGSGHGRAGAALSALGAPAYGTSRIIPGPREGFALASDP